MIKFAICDDEPYMAQEIADQLASYMKETEIDYLVDRFPSGYALLRSSDEFDVIFLDILMEGMDGMETARRCRRMAFDRMLVFFSSSRDYVFDAYDVEAFHYLVKPVDEGKLRHVLGRAVERERQLFREYIVVSRERQVRKLFLDSVRYFEIRGRQIEVHEEQGVFTWYEQIGALERQLKGKGFFRCHKSYLINLGHVEVYNRQEAVLDNGERILIARRRYEQFCQEMVAYVRKNGGIL